MRQGSTDPSATRMPPLFTTNCCAYRESDQILLAGQHRANATRKIFRCRGKHIGLMRFEVRAPQTAFGWSWRLMLLCLPHLCLSALPGRNLRSPRLDCSSVRHPHLQSRPDLQLLLDCSSLLTCACL